jgi:hypothetical protein|tara:strand:+ start:245 stop:517 length:273 start_codon:yes stop_codon:yes gene_type:complete
MKNKEMIHRMKMIIDDAQVIIDHLEQGKDMTDKTKCADDGWVHMSNIEIAVDLKDNECLTWKKFTHNDKNFLEQVRDVANELFPRNNNEA